MNEIMKQGGMVEIMLSAIMVAIARDEARRRERQLFVLLAGSKQYLSRFSYLST